MSMELKKVVVANFESKLVDGIWIHYIIDEKHMNHPICLYDNNQNVAIDINTGAYYHVLKRNDNGKLDAAEETVIELNHNYALNVENIDWQKYSYSERAIMMLKYYKMLLDVKLHKAGYSEADKLWDEREAWKSNYVNDPENSEKRINLTDFNDKNQRKH